MCQLNDFVDGGIQSIDIFAASLRIVWLSATSALNEFSRLTDDLARVQAVLLDHVFAQHDA